MLTRVIRESLLTVKVGALDERDVHTKVTVVCRAVQAEVNGKGNRGPCRVLCAAVEADLIGLLPLQLCEDGLRLVLRCHSHDGRISPYRSRAAIGYNCVGALWK
jgi:hypothetical protein